MGIDRLAANHMNNRSLESNEPHMSKIKSFGTPAAREEWRRRSSRRPEHARCGNSEGAPGVSIAIRADLVWVDDSSAKRATPRGISIAKRVGGRQAPGDVPGSARGNARRAGA